MTTTTTNTTASKQVDTEAVSSTFSGVGLDRNSIDSISNSSKLNSPLSNVASTFSNENDYLEDLNKSYEDDFRQELK